MTHNLWLIIYDYPFQKYGFSCYPIIDPLTIDTFASWPLYKGCINYRVATVVWQHSKEFSYQISHILGTDHHFSVQVLGHNSRYKSQIRAICNRSAQKQQNFHLQKSDLDVFSSLSVFEFLCVLWLCVAHNWPFIFEKTASFVALSQLWFRGVEFMSTDPYWIMQARGVWTTKWVFLREKSECVCVPPLFSPLYEISGRR